MQYTKAENLYVGARIVDDTMRTALITRIGRTGGAITVHSRSADAEAPAAPRVDTFQPEQEVRLCSVPAVSWSIVHNYGDTKTGRATAGTHVSGPISPVYCVRDHWTRTVGHQVIARLIEHHTVTTYTPISLEQLPGEGEPTERPANPDDRRFYRLNKIGPTVLRTGDDVRQMLAKITEAHEREHGRRDERNNRLAPTYPPHKCLRCVSGPHDLDPLEVTITRTEHDVKFADLPQDWDYALGHAMAHARITAANDRDQAETVESVDR